MAGRRIKIKQVLPLLQLGTSENIMARSDVWPPDFMYQCWTCVETLLACEWLFVSSL